MEKFLNKNYEDGVNIAVTLLKLHKIQQEAHKYCLDAQKSCEDTPG